MRATKRLLDVIECTEEERQWLVRECSWRAAACFHEAGMLRDAAECWIAAGAGGRAAELYLEREDFSKAAPLFLSEGRYGEALKCYEKWLEQSGSRDVEGRVKALLGISACMRLMGDTREETRRAYMEARELIAQDEGREPLTTGRIWEALGRYGEVIGRSDLVCVGYEKALSFFREGHPHERLQAAKVYHELVAANRLLAEDIAVRIAGWSVEFQKPRYHLRSKSINVSPNDFRKVFGLTLKLSPLEYVENEFEDKEDGTIMDHATGLTWQQSGSDDFLNYEEAKAYVAQLNHDVSARLDWRLPTVDELVSLLEPVENMANFLFVSPLFRKKQFSCWSSDHIYTDSLWIVDFTRGRIYWPSDSGSYVRAVHS